MPLWFIELALIFIFVIPIICLLAFALLAAIMMDIQEKEKKNGKLA